MGVRDALEGDLVRRSTAYLPYIVVVAVVIHSLKFQIPY